MESAIGVLPLPQSLGGTGNGSGSPSFSGLVTAGTGVTATTGDITATTGNLVLSASGAGFLTNPATNTPGASPQTVTGKIGVAAFTTVVGASTIADVVITNTSVKPTSVILASVQVATLGSAVIITNITPGSGSFDCTLRNLTATPTADNIFITFMVLD